MFYDNPFVPYGGPIDNDNFAGDVFDPHGDPASTVWEIGGPIYPNQQMSNRLNYASTATGGRRGQLINNQNTAYSGRGNTAVTEKIEAQMPTVAERTPVPFIAAANGRIETSPLDRGAYFPFGILNYAMKKTIIESPHDPIISSVKSVAGSATVAVTSTEINPAISILWVPVIQIRISAPVLQNVVAQPINIEIVANGFNFNTPESYKNNVVSIFDLNKPLELTFAAWRTIQAKPRYTLMMINSVNSIIVKVSQLPDAAQVTVIIPGSTHAQVLSVLKAANVI